MKKMMIGAIVGTLIYFGFQSVMWMGGFHKDFYTYAEKQDSVLASLSANLPAEGLFMMPMSDPKSPDFKAKQEQLEKKMPGNPWAIVLSNMNWWSFPWGFVKPQVFDLVIGWGLCSLWLAWFVKKPEVLADQAPDII